VVRRLVFFFFQAEDGIRDYKVTGVQTCALPIWQRTWKRITVISAGPAMNILVAFIIFVIVYSTGAPSNHASTKVAMVERNTPAAAAGLQVGDRLLAVDGRKATTFDQLSKLIRSG